MTSLHSTAITAASTLLRTSPPLYAASLLSASPFCGLNLFDWHLRTGSRVPHTGLFHAHAALMPDAEQPASGLLLPLSRAGSESPVLTSSTLTTLLQRFTFVHLHGTHLPIFLWTFPCCSPTLSLYQSGAGRFGGSACQFPPRGPPSSCAQFSRHTRTVRALLRHTAPRAVIHASYRASPLRLLFHCLWPLVPAVLQHRRRPLADPFAPPAFTGFFTTMSQSDS